MRRVDFASSSGYKVNACLLPLLIWNKVVRNVIPKIHYLIFFLTTLWDFSSSFSLLCSFLCSF